VLIGVEDDLRFFDRLRRRGEVQQSGVIVFPFGESGTGKTTAVYTAAALLPDLFEPVFAVPATIQVREVHAWLNANLPASTDRSRLVLLDGREASDDEVGLKQLVAGLNQLLRTRPDVIVCWPTVDDDWRDELVKLARKIGGKGLAPDGFESFSGPPQDDWIEVLERILIQLDHTLDDVALDATFVRTAADTETNVGRFLEHVGTAIAERVDEVQLTRRLPQLTFVITSTQAARLAVEQGIRAASSGAPTRRARRRDCTAPSQGTRSRRRPARRPASRDTLVPGGGPGVESRLWQHARTPSSCTPTRSTSSRARRSGAASAPIRSSRRSSAPIWAVAVATIWTRFSIAPRGCGRRYRRLTLWRSLATVAPNLKRVALERRR